LEIQGVEQRAEAQCGEQGRRAENRRGEGRPPEQREVHHGFVAAPFGRGEPHGGCGGDHVRSPG
jgi:hypothetical protein